MLISSRKDILKTTFLYLLLQTIPIEINFSELWQDLVHIFWQGLKSIFFQVDFFDVSSELNDFTWQATITPFSIFKCTAVEKKIDPPIT